ncbi:hypothetical protein Sp245p_31825 (plasmid) [Azospirillum baldaniorum]|uniref:Uncharacterized protein n=2 Tax=Azospirillum baldaniorum TaxID=1064539 RepID=A0A9P1NSI8_9PROT|nr:hypothetical protein Sp245p_31825 [Azospirillum baldaniorum]CCD03928.1 protein of unknown function [Azospirillum baldaniorum]
MGQENGGAGMDERIEAIRWGDLYALLSVCTDADLDPLAACLAKALPGFFEADEAYRRLRPRHSIYHRLIGDALRRCGDSPATGGARGEGPAYDRLVVDVCKKLDVPYELGNTVKNESNLLTLYLGHQLKALTPDEQAAVLAKAREEASGRAATIATTAREGAHSLLSHAAHLREQIAALTPDDPRAVLSKAREVSGKAASVAMVAKEKANSLFSRAVQVGERLSPLRAEEQPAIIAKAREITGKAATVAAIACVGGLPLLSLAALRSMGLDTSGLSLSEPLFKATVPCVLHLAYLRGKHLDSLSVATPAAAIDAEQTSNVAGMSVPAPSAARLVIGAADDKPVLSLTRIPEPPACAWHPVAGSDNGVSRLNPLLQTVPNLATAYDVATTKYMEVVVNGPLARAADGDGFRAIVHGADNKIAENARLFEPERLSNIVNAAALFQIVSVAVAQKHLADISRKLSDIKAAVDRIQRFQSNERRSVLTGALRYFEQIAPSVLAGEWSDGIRPQIEHHEAHLLQVQDHLLEDIRHESQEIVNVKGGDVFGSKGMQEAIKAHQDLLDDLYRQLLLCIRARACGWQLLVAFPGEEHLKENRKRSIQEAIGALDDSGDLLKETDRTVREKVRGLSSLWNRTVTLNERKLSLLAWNETLATEVASCREQINLDIRAAEAVMSERLQPVTMLLRIEGERIVGACAV